MLNMADGVARLGALAESPIVATLATALGSGHPAQGPFAVTMSQQDVENRAPAPFHW